MRSLAWAVASPGCALTTAIKRCWSCSRETLSSGPAIPNESLSHRYHNSSLRSPQVLPGLPPSPVTATRSPGSSCTAASSDSRLPWRAVHPRVPQMSCACDPPLLIASTTHHACLTCRCPHGSPTTRCPQATAARHPPHITPSWLASTNAQGRPTLPDAGPPPSLLPSSLRSSLSPPPPPLGPVAEGGSLPPLDPGAEGGSLPQVEGFFPGSCRPLSYCLSLVTPSQTHAVGLVCLLWPPSLRLRHQVQMRYPQVLLGWHRVVSGGPPSVPAA